MTGFVQSGHELLYSVSQWIMHFEWNKWWQLGKFFTLSPVLKSLMHIAQQLCSFLHSSRNISSGSDLALSLLSLFLLSGCLVWLPRLWSMSKSRSSWNEAYQNISMARRLLIRWELNRHCVSVFDVGRCKSCVIPLHWTTWCLIKMKVF